MTFTIIIRSGWNLNNNINNMYVRKYTNRFYDQIEINCIMQMKNSVKLHLLCTVIIEIVNDV